MFCVIQEISTRKPSTGNPKRIEVYKSEWSVNGVKHYRYGWCYSGERFERPLKLSYRISIHQSYRENGKVKKKQFVICTAQYYDIAENYFDIYDEWYTGKIMTIAREMSVETDEIYSLLDAKISPLEKKIQEEYRATEEYKAYIKNRKILDEYENRKTEFAKEYEVDRDEYDRCYDVFGELMEKEYLDKIKREYKWRKKYEEKSRGYQKDFYDNYFKGAFGGSGGSYHTFLCGNYTDSDKEVLKRFYRVLSKMFHPDANPGTDTSKEMQLLNQLKTEWGL